MRKMSIIAAFAAIVVLAVLSSLGVYYAMPPKCEHQKDSTMIIQQVQQPAVDASTLYSVESIDSLQRVMVANAYYDSVFASIPRDKLTIIAKVIIERKGRATISDICEEYTKNRAIYKHVHDPDVLPEQVPPDTTKRRDTIHLNDKTYVAL